MSGTQYQLNHNHNAQLADCLVFWLDASGERVAPIELKGGRVDVSEVRSQLQGAADVIDIVLNDHPEPTFLPCLVSNRVDPMEYRQLGFLRVRFRGVDYPISVTRCGASISALTRQSRPRRTR